MDRQLKIGSSSFNVPSMRSMTEEEAVKRFENHPTLKPSDVKNAWKCCNGYSKPNHLKDQLEGLKPVKRATRSKKKEDKSS